MDIRPPGSTLTSRYDLFLSAPIYNESNGMRLSVLSAFARQDVDPWDEATRLAAMPKAVAAKTLVSTLNLISDGHLNPSDAAVVAARLVALLPQGSESATAAAIKSEGDRAQRARYTLLWVSIAIALSLLSSHHQANTTAANVKEAKISATSSSANRDVQNTFRNSIIPTH